MAYAPEWELTGREYEFSFHPLIQDLKWTESFPKAAWLKVFTKDLKPIDPLLNSLLNRHWFGFILDNQGFYSRQRFGSTRKKTTGLLPISSLLNMCLCRFAFAIYLVKGYSHLCMHIEWQKRNENRTFNVKMHQNFANEINKNIKLKILLFAFLSLHLIYVIQYERIFLMDSVANDLSN